MGTSPSGPWFMQEAFYGWFSLSLQMPPCAASCGCRRNSGTSIMRGRFRELNIGLDLLRGAEAGRGGILLVEGEPGIGKSRILREFSDAAVRHGFSLARDAA